MPVVSFLCFLVYGVPYRLHFWVMSLDPDPIAVPTKIALISTIVHHTVEVIWKSKVVGIVFLKVGFIIRMNVVPENLDVIVSVQTGLSVEDTYGMEKLMLNNSGGELAIFQVQILDISLITMPRPRTVGRPVDKYTVSSVSNFLETNTIAQF